MILHIAVGGRLRKLTLERTSEDGSFTCAIDGIIMSGSACLLAPGILSPRKIPFKGAPSGRVYDGAKIAPPLSGIFPGKTIGTYRMDGADRPSVPTSAHVKRQFTVFSLEAEARYEMACPCQPHARTGRKPETLRRSQIMSKLALTRKAAA